MFGNLRIGTPLYVLHKNEPRLEVGEVIFVGQPIPQYGTTYSGGYPIAGQKMVVDIKVKVGEDEINLQKLPTDLQVADYIESGMVVSESRDAILVEVENIRKNSQRVIESVDEHRSILEKCDTLIQELNPQAKQDAERSKEIETLRSEIKGFRSDMEDIKDALARIVKLNKKED